MTWKFIICKKNSNCEACVLCVLVFTCRCRMIDKTSRARIAKHIPPRSRHFLWWLLFTEAGITIHPTGELRFFFTTTGIPSVIFFLLPAVLTRSLAQTGSGEEERGAGRGWLSPRERDQRKNYQGSKRGPGFGPVGDLPHVNKDRASVAWCCPA